MHSIFPASLLNQYCNIVPSLHVYIVPSLHAYIVPSLHAYNFSNYFFLFLTCLMFLLLTIYEHKYVCIFVPYLTNQYNVYIHVFVIISCFTNYVHISFSFVPNS